MGHKQEVTQTGGLALVEWQFAKDLTFKSITASRHDKSYAPIDFDSLNKPTFDVPAVYTNRQLSQEFQITYTGNKMQGVAGGYFFDGQSYKKIDVGLLGVFPFTRDNVLPQALA